MDFKPGMVVPLPDHSGFPVFVTPPNPEFVAAALEAVRANSAAIAANVEIIRVLAMRPQVEVVRDK